MINTAQHSENICTDNPLFVHCFQLFSLSIIFKFVHKFCYSQSTSWWWFWVYARVITLRLQILVCHWLARPRLFIPKKYRPNIFSSQMPCFTQKSRRRKKNTISVYRWWSSTNLFLCIQKIFSAPKTHAIWNHHHTHTHTCHINIQISLVYLTKYNLDLVGLIYSEQICCSYVYTGRQYYKGQYMDI